MAAILTTIAEVKALFPRLLNNTSKEAYLPAFEAIEYKYLVPLVGVNLYNDIKTKYQVNTTTLSGLTSTEILLLKKMQSVVIPIAYYEELPRDVGKIGDAGPQSNVIGDQKLFGWQYKEMRQGILTQYYDTVEVLLRWLYDNKASFSLWTASAEYSKYNNLLIRNATDFNDHYPLYQPMRTYWAMRPIVQDVQDIYHNVTLGASLLNYFVALTAPTTAETDIIRALKKAMAQLTVYRTCRQYSVRFGEEGFAVVQSDTQNETTTGTTPGVPLFEHHMRAAEQDGMQQLTRAKRLCSELRAATSGKGGGYDAAYDAGPLPTYTIPTMTDRNDNLTSGVRLGI